MVITMVQRLREAQYQSFNTATMWSYSHKAKLAATSIMRCDLDKASNYSSAIPGLHICHAWRQYTIPR